MELSDQPGQRILFRLYDQNRHKQLRSPWNPQPDSHELLPQSSVSLQQGQGLTCFSFVAKKKAPGQGRSESPTLASAADHTNSPRVENKETPPHAPPPDVHCTCTGSHPFQNNPFRWTYDLMGKRPARTPASQSRGHRFNARLQLPVPDSCLTQILRKIALLAKVTGSPPPL